MHVLITGAAGMLGRKLVRKLVADGGVTKFTLVDVVEPVPPADLSAKVFAWVTDITKPEVAEKLASHQPDVIFHLAAVVSGEAEQNFELGNKINLDGTRHLLEAVRHEHEKSGYRPRFVFSSSLAVFGAPLPKIIPDDQRLTPLSSYGTQKAMGELMVADYTRKGFVDGISLRLPTISVRPGKPNQAASGFFSGIIREPLSGVEAVLPVPKTVRHWLQSPRMAVRNLAHAATVDLSDIAADRALNLPGVSVTVAEMIEALGRAAGDETVALIRDEPDQLVQNLVMNWPEAFKPTRAQKAGFKGDDSFDDIIRVYLEDDKPTA